MSTTAGRILVSSDLIKPEVISTSECNLYRAVLKLNGINLKLIKPEFINSYDECYVTNYYFYDYEYKLFTRTIHEHNLYENVIFCIFTGKAFCVNSSINLIKNLDGYVNLKDIQKYELPRVLDDKQLFRVNVRRNARETFKVQGSKGNLGKYRICLKT